MVQEVGLKLCTVQHCICVQVSVLDCLVGLSSMEPSSLELRLHEERAKYLVCELSCPLEGSIR